VAKRKPARLPAGARAGHDDRTVEKNLFSFRLFDFVTCPVLRRIRLVPLESFNALEELQQESHDSVYVYDIHQFKLRARKQGEAVLRQYSDHRANRHGDAHSAIRAQTFQAALTKIARVGLRPVV
jgi:hypothetical protein